MNADPTAPPRPVRVIAPKQAVELALSDNCEGLSWTYNEPTLWFENTLAGARIAKEAGLYTNYVTNGFMSVRALDAIGPFLDSFRVDIKSFSDDHYRDVCGVPALRGVLDTTARAKDRWHIHVEVVTNVIPTLNDDGSVMGKLAEWICSTLGEDTPWHVTRFTPHLELQHLPPTPIGALESILQIGRQAGLKFVYIGNVPGHDDENTRCPSCDAAVIRRFYHATVELSLSGSKCPKCGEAIPIVGEAKISRGARRVVL